MSRRLGTALVLAAAIGFGTLGIFGRVGYEVGLNTSTLLTYRFIIAAVLLVGYLAVAGRGTWITRGPLGTAIALGVAYAAISGGYFAGLVYIPAGLAAITLYTYPVFVYLIALGLLGERLTRLKLVAMVLAIVGIVTIVGIDIDGIDLRGIGLVIVAALAYAIYTAGSRHAVADIDADTLATLAVVVTAIVFTMIGVLTDTLFVPSGADQWGVIIGVAVFGTAVPIALFVHGLQLVEASRASILAMAEPLVTVVLGVVLLGEALTAGLLVGGTMILLGILLIQRDRVTGRPAAGPPSVDG